jgi:hypothetical protein
MYSLYPVVQLQTRPRTSSAEWCIPVLVVKHLEVYNRVDHSFAFALPKPCMRTSKMLRGRGAFLMCLVSQS